MKSAVTAPYAPTPVVETYFKYLDGRTALRSLLVHSDPTVILQGSPHRQAEFNNVRAINDEIRLLQLAIGTEPDGIIGPKTRDAALKVYQRRMRHAG